MRGRHTPGPWWADGADVLAKHGPHLNVFVHDHSRTVRVSIDREEGEANARLISAAPCLLEAAKDMLYALECIAEDIGTDTSGPCPAEELCGEPLCAGSGCIVDRARLARAAIAKATGDAQ